MQLLCPVSVMTFHSWMNIWTISQLNTHIAHEQLVGEEPPAHQCAFPIANMTYHTFVSSFTNARLGTHLRHVPSLGWTLLQVADINTFYTLHGWDHTSTPTIFNMPVISEEGESKPETRMSIFFTFRKPVYNDGSPLNDCSTSAVR